MSCFSIICLNKDTSVDTQNINMEYAYLTYICRKEFAQILHFGLKCSFFFFFFFFFLPNLDMKNHKKLPVFNKIETEA